MGRQMCCSPLSAWKQLLILLGTKPKCIGLYAPHAKGIRAKSSLILLLAFHSTLGVGGNYFRNPFTTECKYVYFSQVILWQNVLLEPQSLLYCLYKTALKTIKKQQQEFSLKLTVASVCFSERTPTEPHLNMTTTNFLLSSHLPHCNCRPDPPCLTFLDMLSQPKSPFIKLSLTADYCQCLLGLVSFGLH